MRASGEHNTAGRKRKAEGRTLASSYTELPALLRVPHRWLRKPRPESLAPLYRLLASHRGNISDGNSAVAQAACHLHSLPTQALELVLIINLVHFPMADENVLGTA